MILIVCLAVLLLISIAPVFFPKSDQGLVVTTQALLLALLALMIISAFATTNHGIFETLSIVTFNNITLTLAIQFDMLAKIMMIFILFIGFIIYRYAQNYLESDTTRIRFLSQFNLVLFSVLLLVMSANLLTAFVAWQLIGINVYLLLNHYHEDPGANRAAKKKFVINRLGDCTFLLAIVLAYHSQDTTLFYAIPHSPYAEIICWLVFVSVMTKCAQFPFHIWLIDTMETPTPVSALMHAGIINAGGILLTRISSAIASFHSIVYFILFIGLISMFLSIRWMNQQPDIKKKLAYSTMGQMGYMLTQCSLGAFPAAVFHLISHGFYKASLFLNAGETLKPMPKQPKLTNNLFALAKSTVIAAVIFFIVVWLCHSPSVHIPVLMFGFIAITLMTLVYKCQATIGKNIVFEVLCYLFIALLFSAYLICFTIFSDLLPQYDYSHTIIGSLQIIGIIALFIAQYFLWLSTKKVNMSIFKDRTEIFLRKYLLNPLRALGDVINQKRYQSSMSVLYWIILLFTSLSFLYGLYSSIHFSQASMMTSNIMVCVFLIIGIITLVLANRCLAIRPLIIYLVLFELAFTNIIFFDDNINIIKIGIFHILNVCSALLMLALLAKKDSEAPKVVTHNNRLTMRVFYLVFSLLLLIGIPGTASFISEFYLLNALISYNVFFIILYIGLIILLSVVIMHSLQLYAFNENYTPLLCTPIKKQNHLIFIAVISLNLICGVAPNVLLAHL